MSEVIIHRTDGAGLPTRARRGTAEAADVRLTRLIATALPADAAPVSELGFTTQLAAIAAASKAALAACGGDLQGLRDAALLSSGYDAGLRVSELVAIEETHIDPHDDGSALLFIPSSKTDQEGQGAWAWLSPDTMRRVGAWLEASEIRSGPIFRRVGIDRRRARGGFAGAL